MRNQRNGKIAVFRQWHEENPKIRDFCLHIIKIKCCLGRGLAVGHGCAGRGMAAK